MSGTRHLVLLALIATSMVGLSCGCVVESGLTTAKAAAASACGVSQADLLSMTISDEYNTGSPKFCTSACGTAVAAWLRKYADDGSCDNEADYRELKTLRDMQLECNPPQPECNDAYLDYIFFLQSTEGQACIAATHTMRSSALQADYAAYCTSDCVTTINTHLQAMYDAGCGSWPAFLNAKRQAALSCSKVSGTYCEAEHISAAALIADGKNTSLSKTERTTALQQVCSACFYELQRVQAAYKDALLLDDGEGDLCIRHNNIYCRVEAETIEAALALETLTEDEYLNQYADRMCKASLSRCAQKLWAYEANQHVTSSARKTKLNEYLSRACIHHQEDGSKLCAGIMSDIVSGTYTEDATTPSATCDADDVSGGCAEPPECRVWSDPDVCSFGCSSVVNTEVTRVGCCLNAMRELHLAVTTDTTATNALFARLRFLSDSCCARQSSACAVGLRVACTTRSAEEILALTITSPSFDWISNNEEVFQTAAINDIALNLGLLPQNVDLTTFTESAVNGTVLEFTIRTESSEDSTQIRTVLDNLIDTDRLVLHHIEASYASRCKPGVTSGCTSAAFLVTTQPLTLLVAVLIALLSTLVL
eukprot:m.100276 g.100276  ORF g.100276 m.100276 type:complete len:595 (+) comp13164_c0_seq4:81-1865(+)